ncbi:hypothetical protein F9U64_15280 [Gracilibacillus oryzae]|uniref:Uncharacterized protein n=1 Tax=Gracilibacillus oryzae TaxID=1672701 RepID=A0A7C8KQV2_9BACI|nr:tetratricopeptide repeat protein [Gracilibacillus oryzae]KAB8129370.1 hypothetical protein F9U64_15280 [Gracilibacillus oryzae]
MAIITLTHHKKDIKMKVKQLTIYKQAKIVEMTDANNQYYIALFYKNKFINAKKLNAIQLQSFLKTSFTYGTQYSSTNPLTRMFLSNNKKYRVSSSNQMFQNLKEKYTDIEMLYVLSMFDNFLDNKKITALCKKIFYQYRRNGQMKTAYRTIINYVQIRPHDRFAKDMLHHMDFQKYQDAYQQFDKMVAKWEDTLYIEAAAANHINSKTAINQLLHYYNKEERWFDALAFSYQLFKKQIPPFDPNELDHFEALLDKFKCPDIAASFWEELLKLDPMSDRILLKLSENQANKAIISTILVTDNKEQLEAFERALLNVDGEVLLQYKQELFSYILTSFHDNRPKMEELVHFCMKKLLQYISVTEILDYLGQSELAITTKLRNMKQLEQNPDQQFALGEIYFHLEQYDKAIKCFEWEMELSPDDQKPLQYLQKCYMALGDKKTAKNYQDLLINISSRPKTS